MSHMGQCQFPSSEMLHWHTVSRSILSVGAAFSQLCYMTLISSSHGKNGKSSF